MTINVYARTEVKDFATWKKVFDADAQISKNLGVIATTVNRDLENPNKVMIHQQFENTTTLQAFMAALEEDHFREATEKAGNIPGTMEVWVGEEV